MVVAAAVVPQLTEHIQQIISNRQEEGVYLLPGGSDTLPHGCLLPAPHLLFDRQQIITLLQPTK